MIGRRGFLAGSAAAAYLGRSFAQGFDYDVAIVGAGAAGISAGRALARSRLSFRIFEARRRMGGRAFTEHQLGEPYDAGAAILHAYSRNPWAEIATELGEEPIVEPDGGDFKFVLGDGSDPGEDIRWRRRAAFMELTRRLEAREPSEPDLSFADLAASGAPELLGAAANFTLLSLGEEPERVSVNDWKGLWSEEDRIVPGGLGTLIARAGAGLPISLATPVRAIDWRGAGVRLVTDRGDVWARTAIVTLPISVLRSGVVRFQPELPDAQGGALDRLHMGALTKIALKFDGERFGFAPFSTIINVEKPRVVMTAETWAFERNLVICMVGGDHARALCKAGERAAIDYALERMVVALGGSVRRHFVAGQFTDWWNDTWSLGSYSIAKVGSVDARQALDQPISERIWLAGEANAGGGAMTVAGAAMAGRRAADAILAKLG